MNTASLPSRTSRSPESLEGLTLSSRRWLVQAAIIAAAWLSYAAGGAAQTYEAFDLYELSLPFGFADDLEVKLGAHELYVSSQQAVTYVTLELTGEFHAMLWNHADGAVVDPHPIGLSGFTQSKAMYAHGTQQVGAGWNPFIGSEQALLWNGSAASVVNLHPTNLSFVHSRAMTTDGVQQGGAGETMFGVLRALLWNGTANSAVNLHPSQFSAAAQSRVHAINNGKQVGSALMNDGLEHALLWSGTAASAVDLHPVSLPDLSQSSAWGVHGNQQVGVALLTSDSNVALLWSGTPASVVNLHPSHLGLAESRATATNGTIQAGSALTMTEVEHAMLWSGSAASAVDLHELLPAHFFTSVATSIDAQGNVYGAAVDDDGITHAVRWSLAAPASPADFDGSGAVDGLDLAAWSIGFGSPGPVHSQGDADEDGDVDGSDFLIWQRELGAGSPIQPAAQVVPEPCGCWLIIAAVSLVLRKRGGR
jgi:hypothetical protein